MRLFVSALFLLLIVVPVYASPVTYLISVDTASVSGTSGSFDFNFNPGPLSYQGAYVQLTSFTTDGILSAPSTSGDVSGVLPSSVTFTNSTGFNDYFQGFVYGASLSFDLAFDGPALDTPDGTSASSSTLALSFFSDSGGTVPILTSGNIDGFAALVNVNLDGTTSVIDFSQQTNIGPASSNPAGPSPSPVPEPSSFLLLGTALAGGLIGRGAARLQRRNYTS